MPSARPSTHRKFTAPLLAAATAFAVFAGGCAKHERLVDEGLRTQTLHLGNHTEPADLDPQTSTAYTDFNVLISLFEGLTCIDEASSKPVPGAAESWDISPDGLTYTFHLRPNGKWSNGDPVTAQDFVLSAKRMLSPRLASEYSYMLWVVKGAEDFNKRTTPDGKGAPVDVDTDFSSVGFTAVDEHTLRIELAKPTPYFLSLVAHQSWFPVNIRTILKFGAFDQKATGWTRVGSFVGNGAYKMAEWQPNARLIVDRNPNYWNASAPGLKRVVFYPVESANVEESMFRAGQLHVTNEVPPERIKHYQEMAPGTARVDPFLETLYLSFNVTRPPFNDVRVRRALAAAIDREAIAKEVLYGSRVPAYNYTPPNTAGYTARARTPYDPEAARKLLAEAGFPGGKGFRDFELFFNTDPINQRILEAIQQMWKEQLGITCHLANAEFRVYLSRLTELDYDVSRRRWVGDYNDPNTYLDMFVTAGGNNQTGWSDKTYDQLIEEAGHTLDQTQRYELFQKAESELLDQSPITPVVFGTRTFLIDKHVKGWVPALLGIHRYQYVTLEAE